MAVSSAFGDFVSDRLENIGDLMADIDVQKVQNLEVLGLIPPGSSDE